MESCNWEDALSWINKNSGKLHSKYSPVEKKKKKKKKEARALLALVKQTDILY